MKIYNEITTIFNDTTGQWETISEDSYNYNGPMALLQGISPGSTKIGTSDVVADTLKITAGYFTGGDGTLAGTDIFTASLATSNEKYYHNICQVDPGGVNAAASVIQFSITYGHHRGSGSDTLGDSNSNGETLNGESEAIYKQFSSLLQDEAIAVDGFKISQQGAAGARSVGKLDEYIYVLVGKRERFKDRINKKVWTLALSGSDSFGNGTRTLYLTDDSYYNAGVATPGGPRFNIVSGALGSPSGSSNTDKINSFAHKTYGWFYPEMGAMVFSGPELSASIPGTRIGTKLTASFDQQLGTSNGYLANFSALSCSGFAPNEDTVRSSAHNAIRLANCMRNVGEHTTLRLRSEEDQTQENYFCRINAQNYNHSNNPTFVSGSSNKIRNITMHGNPQTFVTGVGLYNDNGQLLATARLSSPLKKNFASEATIKVKLTY